MPRILVRPDDLTNLEGALKQVAGQLRALSARLGTALGAIDWAVQQQAGVEAEVAAARRQAELLAAQAEQMAAFTAARVQAFRAADEHGIGELESAVTGFVHTVSGWLGSILHDAGAEAAALLRVGRLAGPAVSLAVPLLETGPWLRRAFPDLFGPGARVGTTPAVGVSAPERPEPPAVAPLLPAPPGPADTRLPTPEEVRYIQQVLGVTEAGYGPKTQAAVAALQRANGIPVDPEVKIGPKTWAALRAASVPAVEAASASALAEKFDRLGWGSMKPWADLIWQASQETGLPPEMIAAKIMAESGGDADASAGPLAGQGLMQIEFEAHRDEIPGATDAAKRAWIMKPENNIPFGSKMLKGVLDKWIDKYGPDEGLKRGLQYWNYGSGAAQWVEAHSKGPDDWQYWVQKYHDTHKWDKETGTWHVVEADGDYGTPLHWQKVHDQYEALMGHHPQSASVNVVTPVNAAPVTADLTNTNAGAPVEAPVTGNPEHRTPQTYGEVIDQFAVDRNPRYAERDSDADGSLDTFCNIYVWDVTKAMGAEIPHRVIGDGIPDPGKGSRELDANGMVNWLAEHGPKYGWREVSGSEAQATANAGHPAVVAWGNPGGAGHLAVVRPGTYTDDQGATISQAGGSNFNSGTVADGFGSGRVSRVRYYTHK